MGTSGAVFGAPQWGGTQWGQLPDGSLPSSGSDVAASVADVWFRLGFTSAGELALDEGWVTTSELYQFGDDAVKGLSFRVGLLVTVDVSISVLAGIALYTLPAAHVFTIFAWVFYVAQPLQILRPASVQQLEALDGTWPTTIGDPRRSSLDAGSVGTITLYPIPLANCSLVQVCQEYFPVVQGASVVPVSTVLQDYFTYALLAGARGRESDFRMPEMADHYRQRMDLYEQVMMHVFGPGQ